jgi:hypothetical protein
MNLDKDKLVIEELSRMKSLFGYERGKVISEQKLDEDTIGSYERRDLQRIDPGGSHLSAGDKAADKAAAEKAATTIATNNTMSAEDRQFYVNKEYCSQKNGVVPQRSVGGYFNIPQHKFSEVVKKYKITDAEIKAAQATCPEVKTQQTNSTPKPPPQIPTELKDINGVKAFQDWLDENKAGWASGYANNILNKTGKGYGRMGPRTSKAWGLFKDEYLNPQKLTQDISNITTQEIQQINAGTQPQSDLGAQTPVTNTTTTTTSTETISQYPPDEPGQPGEYRDGWYYDEKSQQWYKPQ